MSGCENAHAYEGPYSTEGYKVTPTNKNAHAYEGPYSTYKVASDASAYPWEGPFEIEKVNHREYLSLKERYDILRDAYGRALVCIPPRTLPDGTTGHTAEDTYLLEKANVRSKIILEELDRIENIALNAQM